MVPFLTNNRSFEVLKLSNNGLGPAGGSVVADALLTSANISKAEGKPSNLHTVICGRNRLEDGSAGIWAEAFKAHGTLVDVRMPQNGIRMDGITNLARGLKECSKLQHIDFQDNTFSSDGKDAGVKAWADALPSWPDLVTLNLSDCVLSTGEDVPLLIKALANGSNPKLRVFQLQNNDLTTQTFALLAEVISTHLGNLATLELQWNEVEDDDVSLEILGDVLKQRGGKLLISDDDEDDDDDEEEGHTEIDNEKAGIELSWMGDSVDALADLINKATIN
jgi:Ran GTPase-activating protein 1